MSQEDEILLSKWLNKTITPEELTRLEKVVDLSNLKITLDRQEAFDLDVKAPEDLWEQFADKVEMDTPPKKAAIKATEPVIDFKRRLFLFLGILLIAAIGFFIYKYLNDPTRIETAPKEQQRYELADGTVIQLSPGTKVSYFEKNWSEERKVELFGQAYFKVTKGSPFSVRTTSGTIRVLGTAFDIWSFGDYMRVQCFEGKVEVRTNTTGASVELTAGQEVYLNKNTLKTVENINNSDPDWIKENQQIYKQVPVGLVISDIERFHGITVKLEGLNRETQFSGLIPFSSIDETARYLSETMGWQYSLGNDGLKFIK